MEEENYLDEKSYLYEKVYPKLDFFLQNIFDYKNTSIDGIHLRKETFADIEKIILGFICRISNGEDLSEIFSCIKRILANISENEELIPLDLLYSSILRNDKDFLITKYWLLGCRAFMEMFRKACRDYSKEVAFEILESGESFDLSFNFPFFVEVVYVSVLYDAETSIVYVDFIKKYSGFCERFHKMDSLLQIANGFMTRNRFSKLKFSKTTNHKTGAKVFSLDKENSFKKEGIKPEEVLILANIKNSIDEIEKTIPKGGENYYFTRSMVMQFLCEMVFKLKSVYGKNFESEFINDVYMTAIEGTFNVNEVKEDVMSIPHSQLFFIC